MIPVSMVVYWMMIFWLKQSDTLWLKWKWYLCQWWFIEMIFWLKQSDCVNGGLLNDDILIKTKWYQCGLLNDDTLIVCVNGELNDDFD